MSQLLGSSLHRVPPPHSRIYNSTVRKSGTNCPLLQIACALETDNGVAIRALCQEQGRRLDKVNQVLLRLLTAWKFLAQPAARALALDAPDSPSPDAPHAIADIGVRGVQLRTDVVERPAVRAVALDAGRAGVAHALELCQRYGVVKSAVNAG